MLGAGVQRRPGLVKDLWRAQQPPGRLSRMLPRLRKLLGQTLVTVGLLTAGFVLGVNVQKGWQQWGDSTGRLRQTLCAQEPDARAL